MMVSCKRGLCKPLLDKDVTSISISITATERSLDRYMSESVY
jgi:hypothetical protein